MSTDKRRYVSREHNRKDKPIAPTDRGNALLDGYTIRHREPFDRKRDLSCYSKNRDVAFSGKDESEASFEIYLGD